MNKCIYYIGDHVNNFGDFVTGVHNLYDRYEGDWRLAINSFWGGPEYRLGQYLKQYQVDTETPSETINTYLVDDTGTYVNKMRAKLENVRTSAEANQGLDALDGTFYHEKLHNVPNLNYLKLYVNEYNSMLFKTAPQRTLPDTPEVDQFVDNCDGEGNSLNEFWSQVDLLTTVYGVTWVSCIKFGDNAVPTWRVHDPLSVRNWQYAYDKDGNLKLNKILIELSNNDREAVYRYMDDENIITVFLPYDSDDSEYFPDIDPELITMIDGLHTVVQENPLEYIPCKPVYQNQKIYNGVGSTPIFDLAQVQRSVYGDMAEIYSTIAYGAHPTLVIDEETDSLNEGQIGAEPGSVVRVKNNIQGEAEYVYSFEAPPLNAITEIRELVDQKIDKMNQLAMIRSDELIRSSRSGEQIREYDAKMEAFIRKKATNLENAEYNMWKMFFDWTNQQMPDDFAISYNRSFSSRAVHHEVAEINQILDVYAKYDSMFHEDDREVEQESYMTQSEAEQRAAQLGGFGFHTHVREDGITIYMPFNTHAEYEAAVKRSREQTGASDELLKTDLRDQLRQRLVQLTKSTSTDNSL